MSRQGRMHSSPFHVESVRYKYAIEHENAGYSIPSTNVKCNGINTTTQCCTVWNAGQYNQRCLSYKCAYLNTALRHEHDCTACAFYYQKKCFHQKCPITGKIDTVNGQYCIFYCDIKKNKKRYLFIQNCCERIVLTQLVEDCKKKIKSKNLAIGSARRELQLSGISKEDKQYLANKIYRNRKERSKAVALLKSYDTKLSAIGGELKSLVDAYKERMKQ